MKKCGLIINIRILFDEKKWFNNKYKNTFLVVNGDGLGQKPASGCSSESGAALNLTSLLRGREPLLRVLQEQVLLLSEESVSTSSLASTYA